VPNVQYGLWGHDSWAYLQSTTALVWVHASLPFVTTPWPGGEGFFCLSKGTTRPSYSRSGDVLNMKVSLVASVIDGEMSMNTLAPLSIMTLLGGAKLCVTMVE
jgi:hypothetical protein